MLVDEVLEGFYVIGGDVFGGRVLEWCGYGVFVFVVVLGYVGSIIGFVVVCFILWIGFVVVLVSVSWCYVVVCC